MNIVAFGLMAAFFIGVLFAISLMQYWKKSDGWQHYLLGSGWRD